jgi:hypothetical protein
MDTIDFQFLQPLWLLLLPPGWALIWEQAGWPEFQLGEALR